MAKSYETLMECETTIRWDQTGEPAILWTADPKVRREWESWGFPVEIHGGGWRAAVDPSRISYKPVKKVSKNVTV
jgi:hypothetical protein